jgi:hypothetical protein
MGRNKNVNFRVIKHNKSKANAQLLIRDGLISLGIIKNPRFNIAGFDKLKKNNLLGYTVYSQF